MTEWRLPAPAKLNLFLRITGRRPDGYHELQTVFQLLDWGDEVILRPTDDGVIRREADVPGVDEEADLSLRAARILQAAARAKGRPSGGARVHLQKKIPLGSGLGGASSDAATVLLGLNELWGCGFGTDELAGLGLRLGADVPVFVRGHSAWAEGVGERLEPLVLGDRWYVLLFPGEGASTAELFADTTLERNSESLDATTVRDFAALGNAFLPVLLRRSEAVAAAAEALAKYGSPRLSGSGSTLFLEMEGEQEANRLTTRLKISYNVRAVRGRDRSPVLDRLSREKNDAGR